MLVNYTYIKVQVEWVYLEFHNITWPETEYITFKNDVISKQRMRQNHIEDRT